MTLNELKKLASDACLNVSSKARDPYLQALRSHYLSRDYPSGLPYTELSPQLCYNYHDLSAKEQRSVWDTDRWAIQEKVNGVRAILHFVKDVGCFAHSRVVSVKTFRRVELTGYLVFGDFKPDFTATIDTEALAGDFQNTVSTLHTTPEESRQIQMQDKPLVFHTFDITSWMDMDLKKKPLDARLGFLKDFRERIANTRLEPFFQFPQFRFQNKKEFYDQVIQSGGEGCVLKRLSSHYDSRRDRFSWIKAKKQLELDAFVVGHGGRGKEGSKFECFVSHLVFSVNTERGPFVVARISTLPWEFRKKISVYDKATKTVSLDEHVLGKCARIVGSEMSKRSFRLSSARIDHWLPGLTKDACVYRRSDLEEARKASINQLLRVVS